VRIKLLCVGKTSTKHLEPALNEYLQRLRPYVSCTVDVVPGSDADAESAQLLKRIAPQDTVVLLDERGKVWSTPELAQQIDAWQNNAIKSIVFVIGGAFGVNETLRQRADSTWALSRLVFPHELVRLIVVEQLYRAYNVLGGGKYHHD
jgi:23S rRNA (pseudouridine1915-N3)-methyltransferase